MGKKHKEKWYTITQYVDQLWGEILTKEEVKKNYIITKKNITYGIKHNLS